MKSTNHSFKYQLLILVFAAFMASGVSAQESLFEFVGPPDSVSLPEHAIAGQNVRINRRALQSPSIRIELFGESFIAERVRVDRQKAVKPFGSDTCRETRVTPSF